MQIDWVSGVIAAPPALWAGYETGFQLRIDPNGEVTNERRSPLDLVRDDASHSRRYRVQLIRPGELYLSGNPVKLLQGHNLFGSCDAVGLFMEAGLWVREVAGMFPGNSTWRAADIQGPRFTRLDLTRSYRFPRAPDARAWIREVAFSARSRQGSAKVLGDATAVWGSGSRRWSMKVYDKNAEVLHQARRGAALPKELTEWSEGVIRFELTLRGLELAQEAETVAQLRGPGARTAALHLWSQYFDRITFNENAAMTTPTLLDATLPPHLRFKLIAWRSGEDLRRILSKPTFYRVRRELLEHAGVDIASPPPTVSSSAAGAVLDPAGWDPEPLEAHFVEPNEAIAREYGLL